MSPTPRHPTLLAMASQPISVALTFIRLTGRLSVSKFRTLYPLLLILYTRLTILPSPISLASQPNPQYQGKDQNPTFTHLPLPGGILPALKLLKIEHSFLKIFDALDQCLTLLYIVTHAPILLVYSNTKRKTVGRNFVQI